MNSEEIKEAIKSAKEVNAQLKNSPEMAKEFLISAGIIDSKGNFTKHYKTLCTVIDRA